MKILTTLVFSAALLGIVANAVFLQKAARTGSAAESPQSAAAPTAPPAKRLGDDPGATGAVSPPAVPAPAVTTSAPDAASGAARRPIIAKHAGAKADGTDVIGRLIDPAGAGGDGSAARTPAAKADPLLLRAQRQLRTLGYPVKPDGRMDDATRQAVRRFAKDHHLKAEAALTPAMRRKIADASAAPPKEPPAPAPTPR